MSCQGVSYFERVSYFELPEKCTQTRVTNTVVPIHSQRHGLTPAMAKNLLNINVGRELLLPPELSGVSAMQVQTTS